MLRPAKFKQRPGIIARFSSVPRDERMVRDGIPLTTVPRTIFDLAGLGERRDVERALHESEVLQLRDPLSVHDLMRRYPKRPGSRLLGQVLGKDPSADFVSTNDFEDLMADLVTRHSLPEPRFNADLFVRGCHFKPDCLWSDQMLIVELDGGAVHRTRRAFERDRERDRILLVAGYRTIRITWRQLRDDPDSVLADIRSALANTRPTSSPK